jgi:hypothetical protein
MSLNLLRSRQLVKDAQHPRLSLTFEPTRKLLSRLSPTAVCPAWHGVVGFGVGPTVHAHVQE